VCSAFADAHGRLPSRVVPVWQYHDPAANHDPASNDDFKHHDAAAYWRLLLRLRSGYRLMVLGYDCRRLYRGLRRPVWKDLVRQRDLCFPLSYFANDKLNDINHPAPVNDDTVAL
jgi:hypothetical protein